MSSHITLTIVEFNRAKDAVASMIKRLAHRNANVQLYTLEVRQKISIHRPCGVDILATAGECALSELRS